jgi:hypothetical protein
MDLLSRYSILARRDTTVVIWKFHCDAKETSLLKLLEIFDHDPTVGSRVTYLLSRNSLVVLGLARPDAGGVELQY